MNAAPISTGLNAAAPRSESRNGSAHAGDDATNSFSKVLGSRQDAQAAQSAANSSGKFAAGGSAREKLPGKDTGIDDDADAINGQDQVLSLIAGEQGLGLPQLALQIAAGARGGQSGEEKGKPGAGRDSTSPVLNAAQTGLASGIARPLPEDNALPLSQDKALGGSMGSQLAPDHTNKKPAPSHAGKVAANRPGKAGSNGMQGQTLPSLAEQGQVKTASADFAAVLASGTRQQADAVPGFDALSVSQASALATAGHGGISNDPSSINVMTAVGGAAATTPLQIATPLQSEQWSSDFGRQFVSLVKGGHEMPHTAELRLDPPELGPLRISINISDNVAHAIFVSPHAAVRQTIESALPQLQQLLAQAGISLGQTSVSDQGPSDQAFGQSQGSKHSHLTAATGTGGLQGGDVAARATARSPAPDSLIDTFA